MKIIIDAMSGDNAPLAQVRGAVMAAKQYGQEYILVGQEDVVRPLIEKEGGSGLPIRVRNATEVVDMHDDPSTVLRKKKDSSMAVAFQMVAKGEGDAMISAGNTGALLSGSTLIAKRIKGIRRAALPPMLPTAAGQVMLIDAGANAECTAEYLLQFAYMGSYYMSKVVGVTNPRIGLLNIGSEDTKGDALRLETYKLLKAAGDAGRINFIGNVEGDDLAKGACDVAVTDGFTGNVALKVTEGVAKFLGAQIKQIFMKNVKSKLAYLLVKDGVAEFKKMFNAAAVGGAPFLGISKAVLKAHGSSDEYAICSAVGQAIKYVESGIIKDITDNVEYMTL